jgi:tetratricopeptide (TPR) repeat protein
VSAVTAWLALIDTLESRLLTSPRSRVGKADDASVAYPLSWLPAQRALLASDEIDKTTVVWELGWSLLCAVVALSFELHAHWDDWRMTRDVALLASRRVGDRLAEPQPGNRLRVLPGHHPPWTKLTAAFEQYSEIFAAPGRRRWRVATLSTLGNLYRAQGKYDEAEATLRHSIEVSDDMEHTGWRIAAHFSLGSLYIMTDQLDEALTQFADCQRLLGPCPEPLWHAYLQRAVGYAYQQYGRHHQAIPPLTQCLPVFHHAQDRSWEAHTLLLTADAALGTGRPGEAVTSAEKSRRLFRDEGNVRGEAMALRISGRAFAALTDTGTALDALATSLAAFRRISDPTGTALTLRDRAMVQRLAGHHHAAGSDQRSAVTLFTQLGLRRLAAESRSYTQERSR